MAVGLAWVSWVQAEGINPSARFFVPCPHPTPSLLLRELSWAEDGGLDVQCKERLHPSVGVVSPTPHGGPFLLLRAVLPGRQGARTPEGSSFKDAPGDWEWQVACSQDGARSCFLGSVPEETLHWGLLTGRQVVRSQAGSLYCPGADTVCPGDGGPPDSPCCSEPQSPAHRAQPQGPWCEEWRRFLRIPEQPGPKAGLLWRERAGGFLCCLRSRAATNRENLLQPGRQRHET